MVIYDNNKYLEKGRIKIKTRGCFKDLFKCIFNIQNIGRVLFIDILFIKIIWIYKKGN